MTEDMGSEQSLPTVKTAGRGWGWRWDAVPRAPCLLKGACVLLDASLISEELNSFLHILEYLMS